MSIRWKAEVACSVSGCKEKCVADLSLNTSDSRVKIHSVKGWLFGGIGFKWQSGDFCPKHTKRGSYESSGDNGVSNPQTSVKKCTYSSIDGLCGTHGTWNGACAPSKRK